MIYKLEKISDQNLERVYEGVMRELDEFYELNWHTNKPRIFVVENRATINALREKETEDWVIGWSEPRNVFVLNNNNLERESCHHKHSEEEYRAFLKHELSHSFYRVLAGVAGKPKWLWEGIAMYTSGQLKFRTKPKEFTDFLEFYDAETAKDVYRESGFAVELLVDKFGKEKLLGLIKSLKNVKTREEFHAEFERIYGFPPVYEKFNEIWAGLHT